MLKPPLYCSICSSPCLLPRVSIPLTSSSSSCISEDAKEEWLSVWICLRVSSGLTDPTPFLFSSIEPESFPPPTLPTLPLPTNEESSTENEDKKPIDSPKRIIPIHSYCLSLIHQLIQKSTFSNAITHEENVLMQWSIPKWTGYGPWDIHNLTEFEIEKAFIMPKGIRKGDGEEEGDGQMILMKPGYWGGMGDQRSRFGRVGNHLTEDDLISPLTISSPTPRTHIQSTRPIQSSKILQLPEPILIRIIEFILDDPILPTSHTSSKSKSNMIQPLNQFLNPKLIESFQSFSQTCFTLYNLEIPTSIWLILIFNSVKLFKNQLLSRWRANPTGVGSALKLWEALDRDFEGPVEEEIERVLRGKRFVIVDEEIGRQKGMLDKGEEEAKKMLEPVNLDMKDIWLWWNYNKNWKSRRRVWKCVVHGTATARDADWW